MHHANWLLWIEYDAFSKERLTDFIFEMAGERHLLLQLYDQRENQMPPGRAHQVQVQALGVRHRHTEDGKPVSFLCFARKLLIYIG